MRKISIFGIYPPPIGGVSIHIERASKKLQDLKLLECVYNFGNHKQNSFSIPYVRNINISERYDVIGYLFWLIKFGLRDKSYLIHFHNNQYGSFAILFMKFFFRKKILITIHDQMRLQRKTKWYRIWYVKPFVSMLFKQRDLYWIAVNDTIKKQLEERGVNPRKISMIPAFISAEVLETEIPEHQIRDFINLHSPILSIYVMSTRVENGFDVYGLDIALQLTARLKEKFNKVGLIAILPGVKSDTVMADYEKIIQSENLDKNVLIFTHCVQYPMQIWRKSDIFLRPTSTDGDSLTVREALKVKTIVLASDVTIRPKGTVLFKNRNCDDFFSKAEYILKNQEQLKNELVEITDYFNELLSLYKKILNED